MVEEHREQLERLTQALLAAGDIDHLEIAAAMEGSTVAARRPNLQPLPDPEPVAEPVEEEPAPHPRRRLWVPGRDRRRFRDRRVPRRARRRAPVDHARGSAGFPQAPRPSRT